MGDRGPPVRPSDKVYIKFRQSVCQVWTKIISSLDKVYIRFRQRLDHRVGAATASRWAHANCVSHCFAILAGPGRAAVDMRPFRTHLKPAHVHFLVECDMIDFLVWLLVLSKLDINFVEA